MPLIHYSHCPACDSAELKGIFSVKDHTVSGENFKIVECLHCSLRFTQDVPDQQSIGSYYKSDDYISHTDSSKGLVNNLYQRVRKITLHQKRKLIQQLTGLKNGYLLDLGSGTGAFAHEMTKAGWQVTAMEPDEDARNKAREIYGLELQSLDAFYDLPGSAFDAITLWHVLEHVHELNKYVDTLKRIIKPSGKILVAVPNYTSGDASEYSEHWAAYDVPRHLYHFSPKAMEMLMNKHGMVVEKKLPMWFDSFYVSMLSSKYRKGKTNLPGAFLQGLQSNLKALGNYEKCSSVIYVACRREVASG